MENINTISVLIVDDEYLIRSLIRNSVRWEAYGMEVVGEAGDGESALSFIRTFQPQIALVDINMPILNGLELAQKVREGNYKTHIIFLTGYRDFEYAKQAVTYQAFDYLLKPIDADELAETLIRLSGQIAREQRLVDHVQKIEKQSDRGKKTAPGTLFAPVGLRQDAHDTAAADGTDATAGDLLGAPEPGRS